MATSTLIEPPVAAAVGDAPVNDGGVASGVVALRCTTDSPRLPAASSATTNKSYAVSSRSPPTSTDAVAAAAPTCSSPAASLLPAPWPRANAEGVGGAAGARATSQYKTPTPSSWAATRTVPPPTAVAVGNPATNAGAVTSGVIAASAVGASTRFGPGAGAASSHATYTSYAVSSCRPATSTVATSPLLPTLTLAPPSRTSLAVGAPPAATAAAAPRSPCAPSSPDRATTMT
mmetsp:Transcript_16162/g.56423  ORF Transcript_16162/g.56423 Transcript_16162/m.56423 type:complete len:232 (+) Transcript_16162:292-987(+)